MRSLLSTAFFFFLLSLLLLGCLPKKSLPVPQVHAQTAPTQNDAATPLITSDMAWVSSGFFVMGTDVVDSEKQGLKLGFPQPWYEDEQPRHRVELQGFYIDLYEVTQGQYLKFIRTTGHRSPPHWRNGEYKVGTKDFPITFVDWHDANDYCHWLKKRLPSEVQWEKAARGSDGRRYPWGDHFDIKNAHLSPASDIALKLSSVGAYPSGASPYGVNDMVGSVWEWTDSWYLAYPGSLLRKAEFGMKHRVVRGLSFHSLGHYPDGAYPQVLEVYARAGTRSYDPPSERLGDLGFRCAKKGVSP